MPKISPVETGIGTSCQQVDRFWKNQEIPDGGSKMAAVCRPLSVERPPPEMKDLKNASQVPGGRCVCVCIHSLECILKIYMLLLEVPFHCLTCKQNFMWKYM